MVWSSGKQLQSGKYVIEQILGQGGFGITYKAQHALLNNLVVIKTPNESLKNDPDYPKYVKRFIEEGRRLEKLSQTQHPNIVRVRDLFDEGDAYCLVMDFVEGDSLFNLVKTRGALPIQEAIKYISQIGEALKVVHEAGLVHRDAHPGNIMVQQDGKAVLIDFGIASETAPKTISSKVFVNPAFAPHEQIRGDRKPTLDIYALAASLYYAVTGQLPEASMNRKMYSVQLVPPQQHIPTISDELNQAILKGMELEPENRPQTMQEWLEMLALKQAFVVWTSGFQLHNGKYTVERDIAQGGFGITYLARANSNERVVIKTLNERVQQRPDFAKFQQDFVNEALRLAKCNHPNIVKVCEVFQQGQLWCMVMQYIEGEHLADRVLNQGVLSEPEALGYIRQIGEALTVVHQNGLLHRDVKPANIILRSNPQQAVLIDFGIAREFTQNLTLLHTANLSHCFAPIEQYQSVAKRGAYTDVYALAATLYFVLTKRLPEPAINRANGTLLVEPQKINPSISDRVNRAILKGMEIEPQDRPQLMQEWLELLKEPPQAVQPNQPPQPVGVRSVTPTPHSSVIIPWDYLLRVVLYYSVYSFFLAPWAVPVAVYGSMTLAVDVALGLSIISDEFVPLFFTMAVATAFFRVLCWSPLNVLSGSVYSFLAGVWAPLRFGVAGIAWILAFFLAGFLAFSVGLLTAFPVGLFQRQLSTTFLSKWLRFVIVATTSCLGVGLGWLVYQIFPIFGHH